MKKIVKEEKKTFHWIVINLFFFSWEIILKTRMNQLTHLKCTINQHLICTKKVLIVALNMVLFGVNADTKFIPKRKIRRCRYFFYGTRFGPNIMQILFVFGKLMLRSYHKGAGTKMYKCLVGLSIPSWYIFYNITFDKWIWYALLHSFLKISIISALYEQKLFWRQN